MARLLKYIETVPKESGRIYFYFRRRGKRTPLPGLYGSPEFLTAYWALRNGAAEAKLEIGAGRTVPGTVNATIAAFYKSHTFTKNEPITQATDRNILEAFRVPHGDKRIGLLEQRHVEAMIAEKAGKPSAQRNLLRVLRVLLGLRGGPKTAPRQSGARHQARPDQNHRLPQLDRRRTAPI